MSGEIEIIRQAINEEPPFTDDELADFLNFTPKSGAEVVAMLESGELDTSEWVALSIPDPVAWLEEVRRC